MKSIILSIALLLLSIKGTAQSYDHTITGGAGVLGKGVGGVFSINYNLDEVSFVQGSLFVTVQTYQEAVDIPFSSYNAVFSYFTTLWSTPRRFYVVSGGIGPNIGYESINNGQKNISDVVSIDGGNSKVVFGAAATIEFDMLASEHYSLIFRSTQFYHLNSDIGKFTNFSGLGLRYYF